MTSGFLSDVPGLNARLRGLQVRSASRQRLLSSLSVARPSVSPVFSADFLYKVYDAKALTPKVIQNYLRKQGLDQPA